MNVPNPPRRHPHCSPFSPARNLLALLAGALFLLLLSGGAARAQQNCYTVICPTNLTLYTCGNAAPLPNNPLIIVTNATCLPPFPPIAVTCNPAIGTPLGLGVTPVNCVATSGGTVIGQCQFTVTVIRDTQPPQIQCPGNIVDTACPSPTGCGKMVNYPAPIASDNSGTVTVTCVPASGSFFPCGVTTVTCTAEDRCQLKTTCTFTVNIQQGGQLPTILCPPDLTANTCSNCAPVLYPPPTVANGVLVGCSPASGTCFPVGVTTVTCTASNACGTRQCSFAVTVRLIPPPTIACPTTAIVATVPCNSNCVPVLYPTPVVNSGVLLGCNPPSGTCLRVGTHPVVCRATNDCGVLAACTFDIVVIPAQANPPTITCPPDLTATTCSNCAPIAYPAQTVVNGVLLGCSPPSGFCFPIGVNTVTCLATNPCGGAATCSFKVIVRDVPPATITCPSNLIVTAPCTSNCVPVVYPAPVVVNGTLIGCNPPSGTCLPVGLHFVTCRATNDCGVLVGCSFEVRVITGSGNPPSIHCPPDLTVNTCSNCAPVIYTTPAVSGGVLANCSPAPGYCFPIGVNTVTCSATNACGDTAQCAFNVIVRLVPPVTIVCPQDIDVTTCGTCEVVNYPAPVVNSGTLQGCLPPSGFCFPLGATTVNCRATNVCGAVALCKFTVTVRPVPPVAILCPSNIVVTTCGQGEIVTYPPPVIVGGSATTTSTCTPASGSFFPIGTNLVTCCVIDQCQQTHCCTFTVTVVPGNPCVKPPLNMVLWLPFDEPVGPIANNIVPGALNGTHVNGPVPFLGQHVLNSLCFDGLNDFVRVPNYAGIVIGASHFSIDSWVLRRDTTGGRRVIVSKLTQAAGYEFYLNNGVMNLLLRTPFGTVNYNSGVVVPFDNNWHFLAVTVQRGAPNTVRFYLDGALVAVVPIALPGNVGNSSSLFVGASTFPLGGFWHGYLDEVEIFRRTLTPLEINQLWLAGKAGKCKIKCAVPWDVPFPPGSNYVTVNARIWNCSAVPQPVLWSATGPMPIPVPNGTLILPPFTCTNIPIQICRPTNGQPVGTVAIWTLTVAAGTQCPVSCMGSVINPGPIVVNVPIDVVDIPGTNQTGTIRIGLNGLPPGQPVRLRAIGPDMEPDLRVISLNGLPPGQPVIIGGGPFAPASQQIDVGVRFLQIEPIGLYTILLEADLDGDGSFDTLASFDVSSSLVPPPTLSVQKLGPRVRLDWQDMGDGLGTLESTDNVVDGPWITVPGGVPGVTFLPASPHRYFRVSMPISD